MNVLLKLLAMGPAAILTAAVTSNLPTLALDPNGKLQTDVQAENLIEWEIFKVFYHAVLGALQDDQNWPAPKLDGTSLIGALTPLLGGLGVSGSQIAQLVTGALNLLTPTPVPPGPLPAPGAGS